MARTHRYSATVDWTGNRDVGTLGAQAYSRDHDIRVPGKPMIRGSSDPGFWGTRPVTTPRISWLPPSRPATCCGTCTCARWRASW